MTAAPDLPALARRQLADYDAHRPGTYFLDAPAPLTVDQAYEVQRRVAALRHARGEAHGGYKTGCVSPAVQAQLGINHPVYGHLFQSEFHPSGVTLDSSRYDGLAIEGEFAVRVSAAGIAQVLVVIELHHNVFRAPVRTAAELIANNALQAGVVLPLSEDCAKWDDAIEVRRNGELLGAASTSGIPGGLTGSLGRIAAHIASWGRTLRAGELVLTGSPLPLYAVSPGDVIEVSARHAGFVTARVAAYDGHGTGA
jgi:2-keto-4-pentenoate hydratase